MDSCLELTGLGQTTTGLPAENDNDNNIYIYCFRIIVLENVDIGHWSTLNYFLSLAACIKSICCSCFSSNNPVYQLCFELSTSVLSQLIINWSSTDPQSSVILLIVSSWNGSSQGWYSKKEETKINCLKKSSYFVCLFCTKEKLTYEAPKLEDPLSLQIKG